MDLTENGSFMKYRSRTVIRTAVVLLTVVTTYGYLVAQAPPKGALNQSPPGLPISKVTKLKPENEANAHSPASGWIHFDKCLVFAAESIELPSQESGVVASLEVRENDSIQTNQVIAKLDSKIAELEKAAAGLQSQVAASEAQDESEIRLAEAFVEETELQADKYEEMANKGTASSTEFRQRQLSAEQAKVRLIQSKTAKVQRELKSKLAQSAFILGQQKVDRLTLRSPISGIVTRIDHRAGEWVQAGTTVVKIIRLDEVRIDFFIDFQQIDRNVLIGMPVKVISKRGPHESLFAGRITSCDPEVTSAGQIRAHATVQNQKAGDHWQLLPGMTVSMQLQKPQ